MQHKSYQRFNLLKHHGWVWGIVLTTFLLFFGYFFITGVQGATQNVSGLNSVKTNVVANTCDNSDYLTPSNHYSDDRPTTSAQLHLSLIKEDNGDLVYYFKINNVSSNTPFNAHLDIPIDPTYTVGYFHSDVSGMWVSELTSCKVVISLPALASSTEYVGKVAFRPNPDVAHPDGTTVLTRAGLFFDDAADIGYQVYSNGVYYTYGSPVVVDAKGITAQPLKQISGGTTGFGVRTFQNNSYTPLERVSYWLTSPDGTGLPLADKLADSDGILTFTFDTTGYASGKYLLVSYGQISGLTSTLEIVIG